MSIVFSLQRNSNICIKELLFFDSVFLTGELIDVERGYSEMCMFFMSVVFSLQRNSFFCAQFLERWVEWCWMGLQRSGEFDINQVLIVEPVLLIGDVSEAEAFFFLAFKVTRTAKSCFGRERGTPLVRVPLRFWTFLELVTVATRACSKSAK